jgi:hypothetical protein
MRERAKEHFPMVLLTLLSIVQALALELLWSYVRDAEGLFETSLPALISWIQIVATFIGLVLIWVVYASNAMRFRWVPMTSDSVYPFLIGVLQFMLIEAMGPNQVGLWMIIIALIFGTMIRVSHKTMQRARHDGDNKEFFSDYAPATFRDFIPQIAILGAMILTGIFLAARGDEGVLALLAVSATFLLLAWQFGMTALFWNRTIARE